VTHSQRQSKNRAWLVKAATASANDRSGEFASEKRAKGYVCSTLSSVDGHREIREPALLLQLPA